MDIHLRIDDLPAFNKEPTCSYMINTTLLQHCLTDIWNMQGSTSLSDACILGEKHYPTNHRSRAELPRHLSQLCKSTSYDLLFPVQTKNNVQKGREIIYVDIPQRCLLPEKTEGGCGGLYFSPVGALNSARIASMDEFGPLTINPKRARITHGNRWKFSGESYISPGSS